MLVREASGLYLRRRAWEGRPAARSVSLRAQASVVSAAAQLTAQTGGGRTHCGLSPVHSQRRWTTGKDSIFGKAGYDS